jgi:hypothetical protein
VKQTRAAIALQPASPSGESAIAASRRAQPRASHICSELETPSTKSSGAFFIFLYPDAFRRSSHLYRGGNQGRMSAELLSNSSRIREENEQSDSRKQSSSVAE